MRVIVLRGLPGSGKSTYARALGLQPNTVVVSADDYFHLPLIGDGPRPETAPGPYVFSPAELSYAHARCFRLFIEAVQAGKSAVVDNTNSTATEISPYMLGAQAYGMPAEVVRVIAPIDVCMARQTHGVPEHTVRAMEKRLEEPLPPWWQAHVLHAVH